MPSKTFLFSVCKPMQYVFPNHGYVPGTLLAATDLIVKRTQYLSSQNIQPSRFLLSRNLCSWNSYPFLHGAPGATQRLLVLTSLMSTVLLN